MLAKASRSTACEIAWRNSLRVIQSRRGSFAQYGERRLKKNRSGSALTPSSISLQLALLLERPQRRDVFGADLLLQHVDLSRLQAHQLRVLVGHDLEDHLIEIRQLDAGRVLLPVARVAIEHQPLARRVAASA